MLLSEFDYSYPEELIAQEPLADRDASRMMVIHRQTETWKDKKIKALGKFLKSGDLLVINNSKVFPARLFGRRPTGGEVEVLLLEPQGVEKRRWTCITDRAARLLKGTLLDFGDGLCGELGERQDSLRKITFNLPEKISDQALPPLPPYIKRVRGDHRYRNDRQRYQTIYADKPGSAAAPTAGLHFSEKRIEDLKAAGIQITPITLHVGLDTFTPVRATKIEEHPIHGETYSISKASARIINEAKNEGRRVIAVGTTTVRALESAGRKGQIEARTNRTEIFIYPGYEFKMIDGLLTNFHQPRSTLLMLVSALVGRDFLLQCYREAIKERYRLFSYGDCMLII